MPKYCFVCETCGHEIERITSSKVETLECSKCKAMMKRKFPNIGSQKVTEVVDSFTNVRHEEDHKSKLQDRKTEHYWTVEVPRLVQSGTYSIETMLAEGWVIYNDKGELIINKPPSKR
jgi:hypothetical protein